MTQDAYDFRAGDDKFCINCKHAVADFTYVCEHKNCEGVTNPVTGQTSHLSCENARRPGSPCGPEGRLFEVRADR